MDPDMINDTTSIRQASIGKVSIGQASVSQVRRLVKYVDSSSMSIRQVEKECVDSSSSEFLRRPTPSSGKGALE